MQTVKFSECLHTLSPKLFFPEGMGGVQNTRGNSEGVLREIPSVVGV